MSCLPYCYMCKGFQGISVELEPLLGTPGLGASGFVCGINKPHGCHLLRCNRGVSLSLDPLPDENTWLFSSEHSGPFDLVSSHLHKPCTV